LFFEHVLKLCDVLFPIWYLMSNVNFIPILNFQIDIPNSQNRNHQQDKQSEDQMYSEDQI